MRIAVSHAEEMFVEIIERRTNFNKKHNLGRSDGFLSSFISNPKLERSFFILVHKSIEKREQLENSLCQHV
ncbi:hypothetical protein SAMN05192535_3993 [Shouchella rhizosphaerae]|nr:hypothetical protein CHH70_13175 [Shouchella clausii]SHL93574.1 hypothetical protein SAMN05192535_3993 [Shouchella rhizosphaerae]